MSNNEQQANQTNLRYVYAIFAHFKGTIYVNSILTRRIDPCSLQKESERPIWCGQTIRDYVLKSLLALLIIFYEL